VCAVKRWEHASATRLVSETASTLFAQASGAHELVVSVPVPFESDELEDPSMSVYYWLVDRGVESGRAMTLVSRLPCGESRESYEARKVRVGLLQSLRWREDHYWRSQRIRDGVRAIVR